MRPRQFITTRRALDLGSSLVPAITMAGITVTAAAGKTDLLETWGGTDRIARPFA
jgi:hypothetical protein